MVTTLQGALNTAHAPCFLTWLTHQFSILTISNCPHSWPSLLRSPLKCQQMVLPLLWEIHNLFAMEFINVLVLHPSLVLSCCSGGETSTCGQSFPLFSGCHSFPPVLRVGRLNPTNGLFTKYLDLSECFTHLVILFFWSHSFLLAFMMLSTLFASFVLPPPNLPHWCFLPNL